MNTSQLKILRHVIILWILIVLPVVAFSFDKKRARFAIEQPAIAFCEVKKSADVQYTLRMPGLVVSISNGQLHYWLYKTERKDGKITTGTHQVDVLLAGANTNASIAPEGQLGTVTTNAMEHTTTRWVQKLVCKNIYPSIDWIFYIDRGQLVYDFIVHPGADVSKIKLVYSHADNIAIQQDGGLTITTAYGGINEEAPKAYQQDDKEAKACHFQLSGNILSYKVDNYSGTLIINKP